MKNIFLFACLLLPVSFAHTQTKSTEAIYTDGHGGYVYFPGGKSSFADVLVAQVNGNPMPQVPSPPSTVVLGEPDYNLETKAGFFTVGCGGSITVRFTDNALTDIEGPDLYIFEVGSEVEATQLEISKDGITWLTVGEISGGRAEVDIKNFVQPGEVFYYVRLTDLRTACKSNWPGADIDAIGAIGSVTQVTLNSSLMFDNASYTLKPGALLSLDSLVKTLDPNMIKSIEIYGHTDDVGEDAYNTTLSLNRANAVKTYLQKKILSKTITFITKGLGETQPVASNATEEGKQQNRRVSIIIHPKTMSTADKSKFEELSNVLMIGCDITSWSWFNDYPKVVNEKTLPGIYKNHIDDVLFYDGLAYFFNGSKLTAYNNTTGAVEGGEKKITEVFPGITFDRIDASFYIREGEMLCFIKNDSCILYKPANKTSKAYTISNLLPGLSTTRPEAVLYVGRGTFLFFFDGKLQPYDYLAGQPGKVQLLSEGTWGNLWLTGPDALIDDDSGMVYFLKNPE